MLLPVCACLVDRGEERASEGGRDGLELWRDGETRQTCKDKEFGPIAIGHLGVNLKGTDNCT